ncbi:hypothetical protein [Tropicimonas aquimaris]|uniref:Acetoacetate decarboxylase (ADC) n=1 Tax=Tropicimonas aquimaris TaxID=914152 RepID=A0ABW3ISH2_9RHOB
MLRSFRSRALTLAALAFGLIWPGAPADAETYAGANAESRVVLGLAVPPEAARAWLPEGWAPLTLPRGPYGGANLIVVLLDRHLQLDATEAATAPSALRAVVFASFAVKQGEERPRLFVTRVYSTAAEFNPYGVALGAEISREMNLAAGEDGMPVRSERWRVAPAAGGTLALDLSHAVGKQVWTTGESRIHSAVDPEMSRLYRYEQVDDMAMSEAMQMPLKGAVALDWALPEFEAVFDGTETLKTIVSRPHYLVRIYLP